ncbi:MAG: GNAT family N-acetyltransferase [Elusimicrobia bacterium]|nr:GNAT family N-acetyltransferase [Elusimicrobiota bacterium]
MEIRPGLASDETGMRELFAACYGREFPAELWRWQYLGSPEGPAIVDVAVSGGRVVGHLASLPVRLQRGGESLAAALWMDLMIHPGHRGLELFLDLAEFHRRRCAAAGRAVFFAFPNDRSYPLLRRMLDWRTIHEIDALEAPLSELPPAPASDGQCTVERCSRFGEEFDEFWERVRPSGALGARRDAARLSWRYHSKPGADYETWCARDGQGRLRGWLALKLFSSPGKKMIGDILDLWADSDGARTELWSRALRSFRARKADLVSAWALSGTALEKDFRSWGLSHRGPRTHFAGRWTSDRAGAAFPSDWDVAKGDSDVF